MTNRPSYAQLEVLVEFLEQNPGIAKGVLRTAQGKIETLRKWANLATTLNSIGGAIKDGRGWAKYWSEKKCGVKHKSADLSASMRRTGGGTADNITALSALENRMVAAMGGPGFATGDPRLAVNPFPQSTPHTSTEPQVVTEETVPVHEQDTEMDYFQPISPIPGTSRDDANDAIPASSTTTIPAPSTPLQRTSSPRPRRRRSSIPRPVDANMNQFANIEARRVEAELLTAQAFTKLAEHIGNITSALMSIANAISDVARKMPNP